jgi:hypothetical protein
MRNSRGKTSCMHALLKGLRGNPKKGPPLPWQTVRGAMIVAQFEPRRISAEARCEPTREPLV